MRVLVVDGFAPTDPDAAVVEVARRTLTDGGHEVEVLRIADGENGRPMTEAERRAYHETDNRISPEIRAAADAIGRSQGLLFCYPTTTFTLPAPLKAWIEKSFLPGVGFVFDDAGKVRPGMPQVRRLGVVTTTPHGRRATARARDAGRRTILWTLRLNCHRFCRRTFVRVPRGGVDEAPVRRALGRW